MDVFGVDEQLVHLAVKKNVTMTKGLQDLVSIGQNVRVELSLGPNVGGRKIKGPREYVAV